jgi:hypothetical protein
MGERFSLLAIGFAACKSNMLFRLLLKKIVKFMIVYLFLVLAFSNLVECIIAPPRVCLFLPYKLQPKNSVSVVHLNFFVITCSWIVIIEYNNLQNSAKSSQFKSTSYIVVHEVGRNL